MAGTTTGNKVFEAAMALSDNLVNGVADNSGTAEYKARCVPLVNMLGQELYQYSDTKVVVAGERPVFTSITALTQTIDLDDSLAIGVMPHGLVALLFADENPAMANYHEQKYAEKLAKFKNVPNDFEDIEDVYGDI